jgi:hypothetical protein
MKRYYAPVNVEYFPEQGTSVELQNNHVYLSFQDILSAELKDGSLKGLRVEMSNMFADKHIMTALYEDKMNYCDLADAVIALLSKEVK